MLETYYKIKRQFVDAIVMLEVGDFYETFEQDAEIVAQHCGMTLRKHRGVAMAGVPINAAQGYFQKLIELGHKIAVAERAYPNAAQGEGETK